MAAMFAAAGRFAMSNLLDAGRILPGAATGSTRSGLAASEQNLPTSGTLAEPGSWGVAYCYGTRLETFRSQRAPAQDPDYSRLADQRTDMACLLVETGVSRSVREVQPYVRRDSGRLWSFTHFGRVLHPEALDTGGRIVDSQNPSEKLFLHIINRLDREQPVESVAAVLGELAGEESLSLWLMSCELTLVASWHAHGAAEGDGVLWVGESELARFVVSRPLPNTPEVTWERLPERTVFGISRVRREIS